MKYLIVNADDFGYSFSINKGIIKAHTDGIVTATSVMVDAIGAEEAAGLAQFPELSVGLHLVLKDLSEESIKSELIRQVERFEKITGELPDHIDTHKSRPNRNPVVAKVLQAYAEEEGIPVRSLCKAKFIEGYMGFNIDGSGTIDENRVSVASLKAAIDQATDEYNELMCHAGYSDDYLRETSSYNDIRELELKAITSREIVEYLQSKGITLSNWKPLVTE